MLMHTQSDAGQLFIDLFRKPIVFGGGWVFEMTLPKFLQSAGRKIVEGLFRPISSVGVIEPSDQVEDAAPSLDAAHNLVDIIFLGLLYVVGFPENFGGIHRCSYLAFLVFLQEGDMEDVVDLPISGKREPYREGGDDLLDLEGTMIFVVHLLGGSTGGDIMSVEHYQVGDLISGCLLLTGVGIPPHSLLCFFQSFPSSKVHGVHPMRADLV
jgi:hypothetical protein